MSLRDVDLKRRLFEKEWDIEVFLYGWPPVLSDCQAEQIPDLLPES